MTASYEFQLVGETETTTNSASSISVSFTYSDFDEFFVTAKLRNTQTTAGNHSIHVGMLNSSGSIDAVSSMYAGGYYGGSGATSQGNIQWWGGTTNSAFRPFRIGDNNSGFGSERWTICHWQIAQQGSVSGIYWPWVGQCMKPETDGDLGVWGAAQASNNTYEGGSYNSSGFYIQGDYAFAAGSKLTVWGQAHV
tara:strand:- start:64 stop:645 length:582 start_codon:yes stop_codon:yes gene_type:complete